MIIALIFAILFTLGVSAFCSLLEAFILSTTTAEIESLKKEHPKQGHRLEEFKEEIEETSSAILTLNTIANTLGAMAVGYISGILFEKIWVGVISGGMVFGILFFSEIIPKNIGVIYRAQLRSYLIFPLYSVRLFMAPFSLFAKQVVNLVVREKEPVLDEDKEEEIILLAEKHAKEGTLTASERDMISNTLSLDDVQLNEIMTPRTVVMALESDLTMKDVFTDYRNPPFARMPVYEENIDNIVGIVKRRDLLAAYANDQDEATVGEVMGEAIYIPDTANGDNALQLFLKKHQQLAIVVDEFGSTVGVITMEDIMEHILGREIYEDSDVAVDMRELARDQAQRNGHVFQAATDLEESSETGIPDDSLPGNSDN